MALYWPEARLAVACGEVRGGAAEAMPGTLVMTMRPEQADDPEFAEAIRQLIMARTLSRERGTQDGSGEVGGTRPGHSAEDGARAEARAGEDELLAAERRFERSFMGVVGAPGSAGMPEPRAYRSAGEEPGADEGPGMEDLEAALRDGLENGWAGSFDEIPWEREPLVQVVVGHCDEVVVGP